MQNRVLVAGSVLLAVVVLFVVAGAFPVRGGQQTVVFETPLFLAVVALGALAMLAACFRRRPPLRQISFALAHAGLVLLLAGATVDWLRGLRIGGVRLPVAMGHAVDQLRTADGQRVELGFALEVKDFSVDFYDPVYSLFRPDEQRPGHMAFVRKIDPRVPATLRRIPGGALTPEDLRANGQWRLEIPLADGWTMQKQPEVPRWYEARVRTVVDGSERSATLAVNHPVVANGWQVSLVSYGTAPVRFVELAFRKSPGRRLVVAGIWSVIVGVALLCFLPPRAGKERHAAS